MNKELYVYGKLFTNKCIWNIRIAFFRINLNFDVKTCIVFLFAPPRLLLNHGESRAPNLEDHTSESECLCKMLSFSDLFCMCGVS